MAATDVTDPTGQLSSQPTDQPTPHQALYRRWRSQTFGQVVAQDAVIQTLRNAVRLNRLAHGLLYVGPRGTERWFESMVTGPASIGSSGL